MTKILKIFINAMLAMFIGIVNIFAYEVGDIITFGSYPYYEDGTEKAIEWQILEKYDDGTALVISKYCLDVVQYNNKDVNITWEKSTIRKWLNNDFYKKAFKNADKNIIVESYLDSNDNSKFNTKGGEDTRDKLFLLSIEEAEKYFGRQEERRGYPTPYTNSKKADYGRKDYDGSCDWWLRSPGIVLSNAAFVIEDGNVDNRGANVTWNYIAVRIGFKINMNGIESPKSSSKNFVADAKNVQTKTLDKNYEVGDIIKFGSYPYYSNGTEKTIEWQILEKYEDGTALVISKYCLDVVQYNNKNVDVTWETSTIRKWLNKEFYKKAFKNEDKTLLIESYVVNKDNVEDETYGGNNTSDKMFLLSIDEANKYFGSKQERRGYPTPYVENNVNSKLGHLLPAKEYGGSCEWWLRSPGLDQDYAAIVSEDGSVDSTGDDVNEDEVAVRVAFKINLKNLKFPQNEDGGRKTQGNSYKIGDIIEFGSYPYYEDGTEKPIEWQILEKYNDGIALVISRYVLESAAYHETNKDVTWEKSTVREWLNNGFYNKAFRNVNRDLIIESYIKNKNNSGRVFDYRWNTKGGKDTRDKLFLLSIEEAEKYFSSYEARRGYPTPYAKISNEIYKLNDKYGGSCSWRLRSPGCAQFLSAYVKDDGSVEIEGAVAWVATGVRPALKINLKNLPKVESLKKTDTAMNKNYFNKENSQNVDILALRKGFHPDRTRVVFDISDACVWEETRFSDSFLLQIKGAVSKIDAKKIKIGHEIKKVDISSNKAGRTSIKIDKGSTGGYVQVQLLDNPYRIVIDVFKLKDGQTQDQQYEDYLAGKIDISKFEDLNKYNELLSEEDKQSEEEITEADRETVQDIKPLKQTAGKRIIVIDPGHGGDFEGTYFASGAFMGYEDKIQYIYETVDGKDQKIPLTRIITNDDRTYTEYITKQVPKYEKMVWEKKITLDQAKAIKAYFDKKKKSPFKVILTRETDEQLGRTLGSDLAYRGEFALKNKAVAFISMHVNFMGDDHKQECGARGFEIMYRSIGGDSDNGRLDYLKGDTPQEREKDRTLMVEAKEQGRNLANIVSGHLKKHFIEHQPPNIDKEMGRGWSIAVLRIARYPAILLETGYLCNREDRELLQKPDTNNKIAEALYNSLKQYFGIK